MPSAVVTHLLFISCGAQVTMEGKVVVDQTQLTERSKYATMQTLMVTKIIPTKGELNAKQILKEGHRLLQCVQAGKITYERLTAGSGKSNIEELAEKGVPGEVDFFVSHSWHDDKELKFREWERYFDDFRIDHGRDAKCWLDEIIINQVLSGLGDSLSDVAFS
jgi:hypothetical protein